MNSTLKISDRVVSVNKAQKLQNTLKKNTVHLIKV